MTEIKTAQAWARVTDHGIDVQLGITDIAELDGDSPVIITYGLTQAEVHEAAALLEKSREVCEWRRVDECTFSQSCQSLVDYECEDVPRLCPSCGRKVKVV